MKNPLTAAAAHKQYEEGITTFKKHMADPTLRDRFGSEVDEFMRRCALGIWQADGGAVTPMHVEYYNAVYCRGNAVPSALYWELSTSVAEYPGFQPPLFFDKMREYDRQTGQDTARRFVDLFLLLLLLLAAADGAVSEAEAGFANRCGDTLLALCQRDGLKSDKPTLKVDDFITKTPEGPVAARSDKTEDEKAAETETTPQEPEPTLEELLAELDGLCGMTQIKKDVRSLINLVKVRKLRQEQGLPVPPMSLHLVFMGNPGTGKTTVARLLAKIYKAIGVLSKGQLVEVDRSGLVAGFVGQTAIKTGEALQSAIGGVLFIDEAYALANQDNANDFGKEAIEVILKGMEDNRNDLIVIVAGYTALMDKFISANPGLESRFNKYFYFEDYDGGQLMEIFQSMCRKNGYTLSGDCEADAAALFEDLYRLRDENFGNARDVRNLFEKAVSKQSDRVAALETPTREQLMELTVDDLKLDEDQAEESGQPEKEKTAVQPGKAEKTEDVT